MPNSIKDHLIDHERQDEICVGQQLLTTSQHSVKQPLQLGRLNGAESRQDWWRRDRFVGGTRPSGKMITQKQRSHGVKLSMLTFFFFYHLQGDSRNVYTSGDKLPCEGIFWMWYDVRNRWGMGHIYVVLRISGRSRSWVTSAFLAVLLLYSLSLSGNQTVALIAMAVT